MKTILLPTDFTQSMVSALNWAQLFANQYKATLILLHIQPTGISPGLVPGDLGVGIDPTLETDMELASQRQLTALADQLRLAGIDCQTELRRGDLTDAILTTADEFQADLIITGRSRINNLFERIIGTTATDIARGANCPVLIVPADDAEDNSVQLEHIVFTTPLEFDQQPSFEQVVAIANEFGASLRVLHVHAENQPDITDDKEILSQLQAVYGAEALPVDTVESRTVTGGIEEYLIHHHPDLLVMTTRERDFLSGLINPSLTGRLIVLLNRPILVFQVKTDL
jgi:nucleotide-binding universal stress UspA family protein